MFRRGDPPQNSAGRLDSNQRLLAPKASALARLSYTPFIIRLFSQIIVCSNPSIANHWLAVWLAILHLQRRGVNGCDKVRKKGLKNKGGYFTNPFGVNSSS